MKIIARTEFKDEILVQMTGKEWIFITDSENRVGNEADIRTLLKEAPVTKEKLDSMKSAIWALGFELRK